MSVLGETANGSTIELSVGEQRVAALAENPTTGFRWSADVDHGSVVSVESSEFRRGGPGIGAGGERMFTVSALAPGTATVHWKRWRAWEGDSSIDRRLSITFRVG